MGVATPHDREVGALVADAGVGARCLNCGAAVPDRYCSACGQEALPPDPTTGELLREFFGELSSVDGKLIATMRALARPGRLTTEWLAGRRVRYVSPVRLYITCSVVFFLVWSILPLPPAAPGNAFRVRIGILAITDSASAATLESQSQHSSGITRLWLHHLARAHAGGTELQRAADSALPRTMFFVVPLFAVLLQLVYRSRQVRFPRHLAFALHFHAFAFLALAISPFARFSHDTRVAVWISLLTFLGLIVYLTVALQRVYEGRRWITVARSTLISIVYFFVLSLGMIATFGVAVLTS